MPPFLCKLQDTACELLACKLQAVACKLQDRLANECPEVPSVLYILSSTGYTALPADQHNRRQCGGVHANQGRCCHAPTAAGHLASCPTGLVILSGARTELIKRLEQVEALPTSNCVSVCARSAVWSFRVATVLSVPVARPASPSFLFQTELFEEFVQSEFAWITLFFPAESFTGLSCRSVTPAVFLFVFVWRRGGKSFFFELKCFQRPCVCAHAIRSYSQFDCLDLGLAVCRRSLAEVSPHFGSHTSRAEDLILSSADILAAGLLHLDPSHAGHLV